MTDLLKLLIDEEVIKIADGIIKIISEKLRKKFNEIKKKLEKKKLSKPLLVSEFAEEYYKLKNISRAEKYNLIKKYIDSKYWSIILLGMRAREAYLAGDIDGSGKIKKDASMRYGRDAVILINLIIQGYFDEIVDTTILQKEKGKTNSDIVVWLNDKIEKYIKFFPFAFWVSILDSSIKIKEELIRRCITNGLTNVNIHTIGKENIEKIEEVIIELSKDKHFPKFNYSKDYESEEYNAVTFKIEIK
ncbi:MAG: hypothetical protein DRP10_02200 [Candidatus Aenigmatarchaeota archaeon]|nr:MAG: hypothetical protein DRP10_02200 [Candidatus Aenigmarchaeota archaeon]